VTILESVKLSFALGLSFLCGALCELAHGMGIGLYRWDTPAFDNEYRLLWIVPLSLLAGGLAAHAIQRMFPRSEASTERKPTQAVVLTLISFGLLQLFSTALGMVVIGLGDKPGSPDTGYFRISLELAYVQIMSLGEFFSVDAIAMFTAAAICSSFFVWHIRPAKDANLRSEE
jgi:hypothetical protein